MKVYILTREEEFEGETIISVHQSEGEAEMIAKERNVEILDLELRGWYMVEEYEVK